MSLTFYDNFVDNMAQNSNDYWRDKQQAVISKLFDNTTLKTVVQEENIPFNFTFHDAECWLGTVTDITVNIDKDADDYRSLYFEDCKHEIHRGRYYNFDNNYWITYDSSTNIKANSDAKLRRCNNWLKWIDEDGVLKEYPCVLDYNLMSPTAQISKTITTSNGHVVVIVQGNADTLKLKQNQRFLFNSVAYKFISINNYMQNDYVNQNTPMLYLECYWDTLQPTDNLEENIANDIRGEYEISVTPTSINQANGDTGNIFAIITKNGEVIPSDFEWKSSDENVITINNNGEYIIVGNANDTAIITVNMKGNALCKVDILVTVVATVVPELDIIITPIFDSVPLQQSQRFTANVYDGDNQLSDVVACVASNVDIKNYTLESDGNNTWILTNNKQSKTPLTLTFTSGSLIKEIQVQLKALF